MEFKFLKDLTSQKAIYLFYCTVTFSQRTFQQNVEASQMRGFYATLFSMSIDSYILDGRTRRRFWCHQKSICCSGRFVGGDSMCHLGLFGTTLLTTLSTLNRNAGPRLSHKRRKEAGLCARAVGTWVRRPVLFSLYFLLRAASHRNCLPGQKAGLRIMDLLLFHLERLFR